MIPYTDFFYFGISLYALLPNFLFGWWKRTFKGWIVIATGFMLVIQYYVVKVIFPNTSLLELWLVLGYGVLQYILAGIFLLIRKRARKPGDILPGHIVQSGALVGRQVHSPGTDFLPVGLHRVVLCHLPLSGCASLASMKVLSSLCPPFNI